MRARKSIAVYCALAALVLCGGALGVVGGTTDTGHPYVVAAFGPHELCTGALVSSTVVVTAAHCYVGVGEGGSVEITLGPVIHPADVFVATEATYTGAIHRLRGRDIAVVVLDEPGVDLDNRYAQLPAASGLAETLPANQRVDVVGFGWSAIKNGLQLAFGTKQMTTSNLASAGSLSGQLVKVISGACHGDSGAPNLLTGKDTLLAITSYSNGNPNCNGDSYSERLDTTDALSFITDYLH